MEKTGYEEGRGAEVKRVGVTSYSHIGWSILHRQEGKNAHNRIP